MKYFALTTALALMSTSVSAATITGGFFTVINLAGQPQVNNNPISNNVVRQLTGNEAIEATSVDSIAGGPGSGQASGSFAFDQSTGEAKFGVSADVTAPAAPTRSTAGAGMNIAVEEIFSITGTGNISFSLAIDGFLTAPGAAGGPGSSAEAAIRLRDGSGGFGSNVLGFDSVKFNSLPGTTTFFQDVLTFETTITQADDYEFFMSFGAGTRVEALGLGTSASANADFFNTAVLSFVADDTLTVTASDPNFLSSTGSGPVSPVPLPAGAVLMLSGLAALRLVRRKRAQL